MKPSCLQEENRGLVEFLQSLCDTAKAEDKQRQASTYRRAINGIKQSETIFTSGHQAKKAITGVGPVLEQKIQSYFTKNGITTDVDKENCAPEHKNTRNERNAETGVYFPRVSSAPWVIMRVFAAIGDYGRYIDKAEILKEVEELQECKSKCWRAVSSLIKRGIIEKNEDGYKLTEMGILSASKIKKPPRKVISSATTFLSGSHRGPDSDSSSILKKFRRLSIEPNMQQEIVSNSNQVNRIEFSVTPSSSFMGTGEIEFKSIMLLIDTREMQFQGSSGRKKAFLKEKLDEMQVNSDVRNLSVGDMLWIGISTTGEEFVLDYVVERKAIDDLCSSIIDGRYVEQKHRLTRSCFTKIIYLLEGNTNDMFSRTGASRSSFTAQTLHKALCSTQASANFKTHQTRDLQETANFLHRTTKMLSRKYVSTSTERKFFPKANFKTYDQYYSENLKTGDLTVRDMFVKQLLQITGCSPERAFEIVEKYETIPALLRAYENCSSAKEASLMLADITCGEKNRKLGPVLSKRIWQAYTTKVDE